MEEKLRQAKDILVEISEDNTIPKNIREKTKKIQKILNGSSDEIRVKIDKVMQIMDELSEDQNIPMYTRTQIWGITSLLESIEYE